MAVYDKFPAVRYRDGEAVKSGYVREYPCPLHSASTRHEPSCIKDDPLWYIVPFDQVYDPWYKVVVSVRESELVGDVFMAY